MTIHGGKRPNSGRKTGSKTKRTQKIAEAAVADGISPLEYMLNVMRTGLDPIMRFEAAKAAAPYIHPRLAAIEHSGNLAVSHEDALAEIAALPDDDTK